MKRSRLVRRILGLVLILTIGAGLAYVYFALPIGTGYTAKYLCSSVFLIGRGEAETVEEDIRPGSVLFTLISSSVDRQNRTVTARALGLFHERSAVYRPDLGCTLAIETDIRTLREQAPTVAAGFAGDRDSPWPRGDAVDVSGLPPEVERHALNGALEYAFAEPEGGRRQTRAVVVVHRGRIVAERYAEGIGPATPLLGWSMAKTVVGVLTGMMVEEGLLELHQPVPLPLWQTEDDPRGTITINDMLQMSSGLDFSEVYGPFADATDMLYGSRSMAGFAANKRLRHEPGSVFQYSSGTTNILMKVLQERTGGDTASMHRYITDRLYRPLGLTTAVFEPDASGVPVGSSYLYASARDWARIGLFMLNDGVVDGLRLLPAGWIAYMTTPAPDSRGTYGAHVWLNAADPKEALPGDRVYESLPRSMYYMRGHNAQMVAVLPDHDVVVVRLGVTHREDDWDKEMFLAMVLESFGASVGGAADPFTRSAAR